MTIITHGLLVGAGFFYIVVIYCAAPLAHYLAFRYQDSLDIIKIAIQ